jgi:hypothetical protein
MTFSQSCLRGDLVQPTDQATPNIELPALERLFNEGT